MAASGAGVSQLGVLASYTSHGDVAQYARTSQVAVLVVYNDVAAKYARVGQMAVLAPYKIAGHMNLVPRVSQVLRLLVYGPAATSSSRSRAWTFVLDGHPMYVLDLGQEGTYIYDLATKQWSQFVTQGFVGWNMLHGVEWGETRRIVAADTVGPYVWEMKPESALDDDFRPVEHTVTGGVMLRSRVYVDMAALRVAVSAGHVQTTDAVIKLRFSDDGGNTWSPYYPVVLQPDNTMQEVAWRSLGSFMAPGRVIELTDIGGPLRIDGADVYLGNFDENDLLPPPQAPDSKT